MLTKILLYWVCFHKRAEGSCDFAYKVSKQALIYMITLHRFARFHYNLHEQSVVTRMPVFSVRGLKLVRVFDRHDMYSVYVIY